MIYVTDLQDYVELSESPSFEYNSVLFQYDDLSMSRSMGLTLPRTPRNDRLLGYPSVLPVSNSVINSVHEAVLSGEGVSVRGTLYVSEVSADGYECTFTYGDLLGASDLDVDLEDCIGSVSAGVTLKNGSKSSTSSVPIELRPMVCMNYKVELEASSEEYATGYTTRDMRAVTYFSAARLWVAVGDNDSWYSSDGLTWKQSESKLITRYDWWALAEDEDGNLVAAGKDGDEMVLAYSTNGETWAQVYNSSSKNRLYGGNDGCALFQYRDMVWAVCGTSREVVALYQGAESSSSVLSDSVSKVFSLIYGADDYLYVFVWPFQDDTGKTVIAYSSYGGASGRNELAFSPVYASDYSLPFLSTEDETRSIRYIEEAFYSFETGTGVIRVAYDDDQQRVAGWADWGSSEAARDMVHDGDYGYWVAVGESGATYYKTSGASSMTGGGSCGEQDLYGVAYHDYLWVAVGASGAIFYSTDHGVSWSATRAIIDVVKTDFAPMPCVNLAWLAYQGALARGYTLELSGSGEDAAPYLYIMLPTCVDRYGVEVAEGATCSLRYNLPDTTVLELVTLYAALMGEVAYLDGTTIKFFDYGFSSSSPISLDVSEEGTIIHAVTSDGGRKNTIKLDLPEENETGDGVAWEFVTKNETLDDETELFTSDISAGASYGSQGVLQVTNVEFESDSDTGEVSVTRSGDPTLCWWDEANSQMMSACDGGMDRLVKEANITLSGEENLEKIYSSSLTYTATLVIPLWRFMAIKHSTLVNVQGVVFAIRNASWSDGVAEMELVKIPQSLL